MSKLLSFLAVCIFCPEHMQALQTDKRLIGSVDGSTSGGAIPVLFIAGLEDTGHHPLASIFNLSKHVVTLEKPKEWWKPLMVTGTSLPKKIPKAPEMNLATRHMYQSRMKLEIQNTTKRPVTFVLNTLNDFMASYPARLLGTSPNMTMAKQIFDDPKFDFRVLQLSRDINSYLPGGAHYDHDDIVSHAAVLAEHADYMVQQLSTIPVSQRACLRYDAFLYQADGAQAFTGVPDFASIAHSVFKPWLSQSPQDSSVVNRTEGIQSLVDANNRLEQLCSEALLPR